MAEGLAYFKLSADKPTLLVVGGSLGARTLNVSVLAGIAKLTAQGVQVIWQSGKTAYQAMGAQLATIDHRPGIELREFITRMDLAYAVADVVVSRAGALAISELALVRKPVIFVPSPNVAEDHQRKNAEAPGQRRRRPDGAGTPTLRSNSSIRPIALLNDPSRQRALQQNIGQLARPEAAQQIAGEVLSLVKTKKLRTTE